MTDLTRLTLAAARDGLKAKAFTSAELTGAYLEGDRSGEPQAQRLCGGDGGAGAGAGQGERRKARGRAGRRRSKAFRSASRTCSRTKGVHTQAASHILDGFKPEYESTVTRQSLARRRGDAGQAQHGRVRHGLVERDLVLRPGDQPVARRRTRNAQLVPGGSSGGSAAAVSAWLCAARDGDRYRRLDPPAGGADRHGRHQADLWPLLALGRGGVCLLARPGRADRPHGRGCGDHADLDVGVRPQGFDQRSSWRCRTSPRRSSAA